MGLILKQITDPRDSLDRANRKELYDFAVQQGVTEIPPGMPALLQRRILRAKGFTRIDIPLRVLGMHPMAALKPSPPAADPAEMKGRIVDTEDDLLEQYRQPAAQPKHLNEINELRHECKRLGIKTARTDKKPDLRAKLNGQNATAIR